MRVVYLPLFIAILGIFIVSGCTQSGDVSGDIITNNDVSPVEDSQTKQIAENENSELMCTPTWNCEDWKPCKAKHLFSIKGSQERLCVQECEKSDTKNEKRDCELEWPKNTLEINKTKKLGNFEVTLERVGFYDYSLYDFGEEKTFFRADIKFRNIGGSSQYFSTSDNAIIHGETQYDSSYHEDSDFYSSLRPGVVRSAYILYEDVPIDISGDMKIEVGSSSYSSGYNYYDVVYSFDVHI